MNKMKRKVVARVLSLAMALAMVLGTSVSALDAEGLREMLEYHYIEHIDVQALEGETIDEIIASLGDPYTEYLTPEEYTALIASLYDEETGGVGVVATYAEAGLLIISAQEGGAAAEAGIVAGDIITKVDDNEAAGESSSTITTWLRGEAGTEVTVEVLHEDGTSTSYTLIRAVIYLEDTVAQILPDGSTMLTCTSFGLDTAENFAEVVSDSPSQVYIVDLRSNPGGEISGAVEAAGVFVGAGVNVYLRNSDDEYVRYVSEDEAETLYPAIVLTSGSTASAAEIFTAALRDAKDGLIIGSRTYGKGVAQAILDASMYPDHFAEGDALKVTAFRYYTDSGATADVIGVYPHVLVDTNHADEIATIFLTKVPEGDNKEDYLLIHLGYWRWNISLETATNETNATYFTELLEAIPPNTVIQRGQEDGTWVDTTVAELVEEFNLTEFESRYFTDVDDSDYADAINTLATYEVVRGDQNGNYNAENSITRAEFAAMLCQALGLRVAENPTYFSDVAETAWYYDEVNAVVAAGLMQGTNKGFEPNAELTQEQLIAVMAAVATDLNVFVYESVKLWDTLEDYEAPVAVSAWAEESFWVMTESQTNVLGQAVNLLFTDAENIVAKQAATRGETAQILFNTLCYTGVLPLSW